MTRTGRADPRLGPSPVLRCAPDRIGVHRRVSSGGSRHPRRTTRHHRWKSCGRLRSGVPTSWSTPIRSMCATTGFGRRRGSPPASISASRWLREDLGRKSRCGSRDISSSFSIAPANRSQFSASLAAQTRRRRQRPNRFAPLHGWIAEHLAADLRVERLAGRPA